MSKRADAKKNLAKVAKAVMKDPLATQREIAEKAWVWLWTANRAKKQLEQNGTKDDRIQGILDSDIAIVALAQGAIVEKLTDPEQRKKTGMWEISRVAAESTKRYTIFGWDVTDEKWALKDLSWLSVSDLLDIVNS